jgi:hypothetical protein
MTEINGIDMRHIKCCDPSPDTRKAGVSFEQRDGGQHVLCFHFLERYHKEDGTHFDHQEMRSMFLNKENRDELIAELKAMRFPRKKKN